MARYCAITRLQTVSDPTPFFSHSKPTTSGWIEKIYDSGLGFLFVGTSNQGVKTFNLSTHEYTDLLTYNEDHTEIYVRDFIRNTDKEFWIATESGIYIYNAVQHSFQHLKKIQSTLTHYRIMLFIPLPKTKKEVYGPVLILEVLTITPNKNSHLKSTFYTRYPFAAGKRGKRDKAG